ncbi:fructose-specific PTS transporter subunit EIIC [Streptomyces sp. NPDC005438]|uniref:PTS fructose transporter subunit IIABC n=1 Tax=Streptomyces sp. NPDC005438 TaxID=3156880 RepID=UPI0033A5C6F0
MSGLVTPRLVDPDLTADTREQATRSLAERMVAAGRVTDLEGFLADVAAREAQMPTGLEGGIGIPHCRSDHVVRPTLAFGRARTPVDFGAPDGPADLIFLIAAPTGGDADHLAILSGLARRLLDPDHVAALRATDDPQRLVALLEPPEPVEDVETSGGSSGSAPPAADEPERPEGPDDARSGSPEGAPGSTPAGDEKPPGPPPSDGDPGEGGPAERGDGEPERRLRLVAVTSCPTGIAHTYMAAEALSRAATEAGHHLDVEPQGSGGFTPLDPEVVAAADGVILAHDVEVRDRQRFAGKPTVEVGVKAAINRPESLVAELGALVAAAPETGVAPAGTASGEPPPMERSGRPGEGYASQLRVWLMTGVSHMVPFVAAGGLLIALAFAMGGYEINEAPSVAKHFGWGELTSWAALFFQTGDLAFGFLIPVLAGYIAYGMADRPGLVPGFVGGAIATTVDAGFLGGLAAGLLAGAVVRVIQRVSVPAALRGVMPVAVIPLLSSAVVGLLMFVVVGKPIARAQRGMTDWLGDLTGTNALLLGALLGMMMCFDLGGPVNKVAYAFATGQVASADPGEGALQVMAAVMAAGMVPPLAMALASTVRSALFTPAERENGKAAWVLGASFITEGAIPFAASDPLRVIPSTMVGGAVTGGLTMAFGCTLRAPHGGVFVLPLMGSPLLCLLAIGLGTLVAAALVVPLKQSRLTGERHRQRGGRPADEANSSTGTV